MHVNHAFVLDFIKNNVPSGRILDYGCGVGKIVRAVSQFKHLQLRTFYEGSHSSCSSIEREYMNFGGVPLKTPWMFRSLGSMVLVATAPQPLR